MSNFKTDVQGRLILVYQGDDLKTPIAVIDSADDVEDLRGAIWQAVQTAYDMGIESVYEKPIWAASKFPVTRPAVGAHVLAWDDIGGFIGNGIATETRDSGIGIKIRDGRMLDSNTVIHWVYALQSDK